LASSALFEGDEVKGFRLPNWEIDFVDGPPEQAETWDAVYRTRERYRRDVLNADFLSWVEHFAGWFVRQVGRNSSADEVAAQLPRYIDGVIQDRFADRAFLKAEAFRVIHTGCQDAVRGSDVRSWLWSFVEYAV
jgi:hypothetical protein